MRCPNCGKKFDPDDARDSFLRHLKENGHEEDFDDYYDEDLCGMCNYEEWSDSYEEEMANSSEKSRQFHNIWDWVKGD